MCNLSQGIEDKGIAIGEGREKAKIIISMYKNGFTAEQIAAATDNDIEDVAAIIRGEGTRIGIIDKLESDRLTFKSLEIWRFSIQGNVWQDIKKC